MSGIDAWYERLEKLPVAVMSDVLTAMGLPDQVLDASIRPFDPTSVVAGPALCLTGREGPERPVAAERRLVETLRQLVMSRRPAMQV